jgi:hypothetical protein
VFAGGYVFGTFSYFSLRLIFRFRPSSWGKSRFHEVALCDKSLERIWGLIGAPGKQERYRLQGLYAGAAFDFDALGKSHKGVHKWLVRRWNAFNIAANSIWALVLSLPAGPFIGVPPGLTWGILALVFGVVLGVEMIWAWRDTMHMLEFMASLEANKPDPPQTKG